MNLLGIDPPTIRSSNLMPSPRGTGAMRTQQSPNCPRPPDCFLWRPCPSARADRLAIGDAWPAQLGRDAELALQLRQRNLEMALAEARHERLMRLGAPLRGEARILVVEAMEPGLQ